jgi:mannosylglycerate hydrolase
MKTIHIVSHTHWDREWYLTFQQFRLKLVYLIDGLLDILREDLNFKYFMLDGQTIVLEDYLHMRPEREEELRRFIQRGRIIIGPWHILPDMFLVSPEAHIRNLIEGDRTAQRFGPKMMVGYMPDSFGHIGQMPQILHGFGIESASLWRGVDDQPCEFWWQSPNGSRVFMANLRDSYSNGSGLPAGDSLHFAEMLKQQADSLAAHSAASDLLIMFGTDHMEPNPLTSKAIDYANSKLGDVKVIHSTLADYIASVQSSVQGEQLPTVKGELRSSLRSPLLPNVLSSRMWIKQDNYECESLLEKWTEPFSVFAERTIREISTGRKVGGSSVSGISTASRINQPSTIIRQAWRMLMENHPHDSICGCSIDQVHDEMRVRFDQVKQIGEELTHQSLATLAAAVVTDRGPRMDSGKLSSAVVVFNPSSNPRTDLVNVEINLPAGMEAFDLVDDTGAVIPHEALGMESSELANIILDRKGLRDALTMVSDGRVTGMGVQAFTAQREGQTANLELILSESDPNAEAWQRGIHETNALLDDETINSFHVRARTLPSNKIIFSAPHIPAIGYRTFHVQTCELPDANPTRLNAAARLLMPLAKTAIGQQLIDRFSREPAPKPPYIIENEFFQVKAESDSTLTLTDKRDGTIYPGLNQFVDTGDRGDEYNYCPVDSESESNKWVTKFWGVRINRSEVRQTLELAVELTVPAQLSPDRKSRSTESVALDIVTRISLSPGIPRVDIHTEIENNANDHRLRVLFPTGLDCDNFEHPVSADFDGHFEIVRRPIGVEEPSESAQVSLSAEHPRPEVPQRVFTDVSNGIRGLMIANRGLPEVEVLKRQDGNAEIAITLLRCVGWLSRDDLSTRPGHAGPGMETPKAQMPGTWSFYYAVIPHVQGQSTPFPLAYNFGTPLRAAATSLHYGVLPPTGSFIELESTGFVISCIKETDDGRGWLVRGYNLTGNTLPVSIKLWRPFRSVEFANLAEKKTGPVEVPPGGRVTFSAGPFEIVTLVFND